jgi:lysophospholipase L1-like esterase
VLLVACAGHPRPANVLATAVPTLSASPGPCPEALTTEPSSPLRFDAPGGGCIAADQMAEYRCGPDADPVLVIAGRRFLGGTFGVPVRRLPQEARLLGRARSETIFARPGEPATVYVRRAGALERWVAVAPQGPGSPTVLLVGDSIMVGSHRAVARALPEWTPRVIAKVGRNTTQGIQEVARRGVLGADAVVVELGTNDNTAEGYPALVRRMLSLVRSAHLVIWVTVHRDLPFVSEINDDIRRLVADLPNAVVADWAGAVTPADLLSDGIHPSDQGKRLMADLLSTPLERWYLAARGRGDAVCVPSG